MKKGALFALKGIRIRGPKPYNKKGDKGILRVLVPAENSTPNLALALGPGRVTAWTNSSLQTFGVHVMVDLLGGGGGGGVVHIRSRVRVSGFRVFWSSGLG